MNQTQTTSTFSPKALLFSLGLQFGVFLALTFLLSYFLMKLPRFENYLSISSWVIMGLVSLVNAICSRTKGKLALLYAGVSSLLFALLSFGIGLLMDVNEFRFTVVLLRLGMHILLSLFITMLSAYFSTKKKRKSGKFRFSK